MAGFQRSGLGRVGIYSVNTHGNGTAYILKFQTGKKTKTEKQVLTDLPFVGTFRQCSGSVLHFTASQPQSLSFVGKAAATLRLPAWQSFGLPR